jgi:hypothetical protein
VHPLAAAAMLVIIGIAATAIVLLRRSTLAQRRLLEVAVRTRRDPPTVEVRSPVFVATVSGRRYHLGCMVGEVDYEYAIWTTRSHRVVQLFEATDDGWTEAWDVFVKVEHDDAPAWLDHRGAPRSRLEWKSRSGGAAAIAASTVRRS